MEDGRHHNPRMQTTRFRNTHKPRTHQAHTRLTHTHTSNMCMALWCCSFAAPLAPSSHSLPFLVLATFSGSIRSNMFDMFPNSSLTTQLALSWPDPYFCNIPSMTYNGVQKQWNGGSYQGTVVLVKKGKCSPYTKCTTHHTAGQCHLVTQINIIQP